MLYPNLSRLPMLGATGGALPGKAIIALGKGGHRSFLKIPDRIRNAGNTVPVLFVLCGG